MVDLFPLVIISMFGYSTKCSLLENKIISESVDLLKVQFELEKRYRHAEFEILVTKLNEIDAKIKPELSNTASENLKFCKGDDVSALEVSNKRRDNDIKILKAAFRNEKEENKKYRHTLVELKQTLASLVGIVKEFKGQLDMMSFVVDESFSAMNQCNSWRNEVGKSLSMLDIKMDESIVSLQSLSHMEYIVNILNDTKTSSHISQICSENPTNTSDEMKNVSVIEPKKYPSCAELLSDGHGKSGVYTIYPNEEIGEINVYCDQETDSGGWTVFQRRQDGSVSFHRSWSEYKHGFGDIEGEFWLGNDIISTMTTGDRELRVELGDFEGNHAYASYGVFNVGPESSGYKLKVDTYDGTAGDSLRYHNGMQFSAIDQDNDVWEYGDSCAKRYNGCWWYKGCYQANLNGVYKSTEKDEDEDGLVWSKWKGFRKSVKSVEMKFR